MGCTGGLGYSLEASDRPSSVDMDTSWGQRSLPLAVGRRQALHSVKERSSMCVKVFFLTRLPFYSVIDRSWVPVIH